MEQPKFKIRDMVRSISSNREGIIVDLKKASIEESKGLLEFKEGWAEGEGIACSSETYINAIKLLN